jgi:cytochrome c553
LCGQPRPQRQKPEPGLAQIAGQNKGYRTSALQAYRDGTRSNPLMSPVAKGLAEGDIEVLV